MNSHKRIGFVLFSLLLCSLFNTTYADPPLPTPIGRVVWIKGALKAIMANKEERLLQKMSIIYLHDTLVTDPSSEAQIAFTDESLMTFYPNTTINVDKYAYKPAKKGGSGSYVMGLITGGFRTITGFIGKNSSSDYAVNTPVATIGVRGTDYAVYVKNNQVYVGRYTGKPCVKNKNKPKELCLTADIPYAFVPSADSPPEGMTTEPDVFKEKLDILPFSIAPFGMGQVGQGGVITSFCISQ